MDVVPHAGAVRRGVVLAEDADVIPLTQGCFHHQRDQVGFGVVILADACLRVGTSGVEVAQRHIADVVGAVAPLQHIFNGQFRRAVGIGGFRAVPFLNGLLLRLAVGRRRRRKHDLVHAVSLHGRQQGHRALHVVAVVLQRVGHALAHQRKCREVDDAVDFVFREDLMQERAVPQIAYIHLPRALDGLPVSGAQIVRHHNFVAPLDQQRYHVAADIAGSAGHQNGFHIHVLLIFSRLYPAYTL